MTIRDIENRIDEVREAQATDCGKWVFHALTPLSSGRMSEVHWGSLAMVADRGKDAQRKVWRLGLEPHMRRAISFGCLAFVLLGCPVAIMFQRGDFLSAFISCFLPIILLYYPLLMLGFNVSKEGMFPPVVLWLGNGMLVLFAVVAFRPVLRH
jgi:lipopolysaccharide export system permease protein